MKITELVVTLFLFSFIAIGNSRNYPLYKQCDSKWGSKILGFGSQTLCDSGCLVSSIAMALKSIGQDYDPDSLNTWLKQNNGFSVDAVVWSSITSLGLSFQGKVYKSDIKKQIDNEKIVICKVLGRHWVLAYGYTDDKILVNDAGHNKTQYLIQDVVEGQTAIYRVN